MGDLTILCLVWPQVRGSLGEDWILPNLYDLQQIKMSGEHPL